PTWKRNSTSDLAKRSNVLRLTPFSVKKSRTRGEIELAKEDLSGYSGLARGLLQKEGAQIGDRIRLGITHATRQEVVEGLLMPRFNSEREDYVVVKLKTGYNVGVRIDSSSEITLLGKGAEPHFTRPSLPARTTGLPKVSIIST